MKGDTQRQGMGKASSVRPGVPVRPSRWIVDVNEGTLGEGVATTQAVTAVPASAGVDAL